MRNYCVFGNVNNLSFVEFKKQFDTIILYNFVWKFPDYSIKNCYRNYGNCKTNYVVIISTWENFKLNSNNCNKFKVG